jgi:predicted permease
VAELEILSLTFPVFAIVVIGYVTVKIGIISADIAAPLVQFVYRICLPALMFHIVASDPIKSLLNWDFWIAFGGGSLLVLGLVILIGWRRLGNNVSHRALLAFSAVQTNTGFVALPILHAIFGAKGVPPAAIANLIIAAIMFPMLAIILQTARKGQPGERKPTWRLVSEVLLSPMVWPTLLGFVFAAFAIPVPKPVNDILVILGSALTPCALFAIGASIDVSQTMHDIKRIAVLSTVKLIALPAVVFVIGLTIGMAPFFVIAATICASVPTAKNIFFLANDYHVGEKSAAAMISTTTVIAVLTMTLWLLVLAALYPSVFHGQV